MKKVKWACAGVSALTLFVAAHIGMGVIGGMIGGGGVAAVLHAGHSNECCCEEHVEEHVDQLEELVIEEE